MKIKYPTNTKLNNNISNQYSNFNKSLPDKAVQTFGKDSFESRLTLNTRKTISFGFNPIKKYKEWYQFKTAQNNMQKIKDYVLANENANNFILRHYNLDLIEGLQYGIKPFENLTMKEIQYLCENLHVIAVKRGCKNMCAYCYADAKPSKREMSWEDFTEITNGFKTLRERLLGLDIWGTDLPTKEPIYKTTELFYDSDCIELVIKDKKGKSYDFIDLSNELCNALERKTAFVTAGWNPNNQILQERAEKYAKHFALPSNMDKLEEFALSFNLFNASYVASIKALKLGDKVRAESLRNKFTDRIANAIFTFTPLLNDKRFVVQSRCFSQSTKNAKGFTIEDYKKIYAEVLHKVSELYKKDLNGEQKYIKTNTDYAKYIKLVDNRINNVDTNLNSSGRMGDFLKQFNIEANLQNHTDTTKIIIDDLKSRGRYHKYLFKRLIDTDGKVYHMDYARFIPTELQLNIKDKNETPQLANLVKDFVITKELLNKK